MISFKAFSNLYKTRPSPRLFFNRFYSSSSSSSKPPPPPSPTKSSSSSSQSSQSNNKINTNNPSNTTQILNSLKQSQLKKMASKQKQLFRFPPGESFSTLLKRNQEWAQRTQSVRPALFPTNAQGQSPQILWIGCADSRVPPETLLDLLPGEVFVHRNIANSIPNGDLNALSVIQYAVEVLKVKHIIVCGHYDCGGIWASLTTKKLGLIDNWLRGIRDVKARNKRELDPITDPRQKANRLAELNVIAQVHNVKRNDVVMEAVACGDLEVHGCVYDVGSGLLSELDIPEDEDHDEYFITSSCPPTHAH